MIVREINTPARLAKDISIFQPYLELHTKEILEMGGKAYLSTSPDGLFIYDDVERNGTIYTKSTEVFDWFFNLERFDYVWSELPTEHRNQIYDVYSIDPTQMPIISFKRKVCLVFDEGEIKRFMIATNSGMNHKWPKVAFSNGEKCFGVRFGKEIAGLGWVSLYKGVGRLHSLYVKPQYRRIGIGEDIMRGRLLWLKSMGCKRAFCEINCQNVASVNNARKAGMQVNGQVFQYFR